MTGLLDGGWTWDGMLSDPRVTKPPEEWSRTLTAALAKRFSLPSDHILVGVGSAALIHGLLARSRDLQVVFSQPSFALYESVSQFYGIRTVSVDLQRYRHNLDSILRALDRPSLVVLDSPHGVTGTALATGELAGLATSLPTGSLLLWDNAYGEYERDDNAACVGSLVSNHSQIVVSKTFSKAFGGFGLRVGYLVGQPAVLASRGPLVLKYDLPSLSQAGALACLTATKRNEWRVEAVRHRRSLLGADLNRFQVPYVVGFGDSLLADLSTDWARCCNVWRSRGLAVRDQSEHGLFGHLQVSLTQPFEVQDFRGPFQ